MSAWLSPQGAADYLGISKSTLYNLRRAGTGPKHFKRGQLIRYTTTDLDAWMRQEDDEGGRDADNH